MIEKVRLDKFLWAVRLFKTRADATAACTKGSVLVNNMPAKQSRAIVKGDVIYVKNAVIYRTYKVIELLEKRIGAKLVKNYIEETTSEDDLFKLKLYQDFQKPQIPRVKPGRPTKKDRRDIDKFMNN